MECVVTLGAIIVLALAIYFWMRLRALEKKSREIDALKQEVAMLWAKVGGEGEATAAAPLAPGERAAQPLPPTSTPATAPVTPSIPAPALAAASAPTPKAAAPIPATPPAPPAAAQQPAPVPAGGLRGFTLTPAPVAAKAGPTLAERLPDNPIWNWFMGSHMVVRVGIAILFIGVAFLLKYAADQGWLSIELRLAGAAVLGVALVVVGWRLRQKQRIYALTLQGGGLGIAYLTTFVAFRIYELLPAPLAFGLLVAIGILCGALAVLNDAKALALPAIIGGFAAPFLVSTGQGSHVTLFSYFTLLNAAILLIAWYKSWRELNLVGFVFTFVLATFWGGAYYKPEFLASVEPFLILFFLFYLAIGLLFARRQPPHLVGFVDGTLIFGTPVIVMAWQALLVRETEYGLAISAAGMGLLYLLLFAVLPKRSPNFSLLRQSYLAIGTILLTLAVPFAVDAQLTSAVWALAGAGILWLGLRQQRRFHTLWGGLVQVGAALFFANHLVQDLVDYGVVTQVYWLGLLETIVVSGVLIAVAALLTGYLTLIAARRGEKLLVANDLWVISWGATLWGLGWWYGTGIYAVVRYLMGESSSLTPIAAFLVLTAVAGEWLGGRLHWRAVRLTSLLLWVGVGFLALFHVINAGPLLSGWGWLVWPAAVVVHYWMLYRLDHVPTLRIYHSIGLWLLAELAMFDLIAREITWYDNPLWGGLAVLAVPIFLVLFVTLYGQQIAWPVAKHYSHYLRIALAPLIALLVLVSIVNNLSNAGDSTPLPYLPLLNPLTIGHLALLATLAIWIRHLRNDVANRPLLRAAWVVEAALFFLWFNADVARIVHYFWGVPLEAETLLHSSLLQALYSIIWTLLAMALMFGGTRTARRWLWLVGAALLALTVIKLLVLDLSAADTLARIVSFIVVGLLMLLIGYFSPIPPVVHAQDSTENPPPV